MTRTNQFRADFIVCQTLVVLPFTVHFPDVATQSGDSLLTRLFGAGKGSGAAFLFAVLWLMGVGVCLLFRGDPHIWKMDGEG